MSHSSILFRVLVKTILINQSSIKKETVLRALDLTGVLQEQAPDGS